MTKTPSRKTGRRRLPACQSKQKAPARNERQGRLPRNEERIDNTMKITILKLKKLDRWPGDYVCRVEKDYTCPVSGETLDGRDVKFYGK